LTLQDVVFESTILAGVLVGGFLLLLVALMIKTPNFLRFIYLLHSLKAVLAEVPAAFGLICFYFFIIAQFAEIFVFKILYQLLILFDLFIGKLWLWI